MIPESTTAHIVDGRRGMNDVLFLRGRSPAGISSHLAHVVRFRVLLQEVLYGKTGGKCMRSCKNCILCKAVRCETSFYEDYMAKFDDCEFYAESWEEYEKIVETDE